MENFTSSEKEHPASNGSRVVTDIDYDQNGQHQAGPDEIPPPEPRRGKPLAFHMSFISLLIMLFICALDATVLGVAIPVR